MHIPGGRNQQQIYALLVILRRLQFGKCFVLPVTVVKTNPNAVLLVWQDADCIPLFFVSSNHQTLPFHFIATLTFR